MQRCGSCVRCSSWSSGAARLRSLRLTAARTRSAGAAGPLQSASLIGELFRRLSFNPDLALGEAFAGDYAVFMVLLEWSAPGYIARVWNLAPLSGVKIAGIPLEELLFGFAFGCLLEQHLRARFVAGCASDRPDG